MNNTFKNSLLFIILFLAIGCNKKESETDKISNSTPANENIVSAELVRNIKIVTSNLEKKSIATNLKLVGKIDVPPQNLVSVSAPMGGFLKSTKLLPGHHVRKGEIIATMEDPQYIQIQHDYLIAKAKLAHAEQEYTRQKELNQNQAGIEKTLQQAVYEVNSQKITMNALGEKLKLINISPSQLSIENLRSTIQIYSKISGYVSKVNVNIGKYVNPTDVLFELIDPLDIHLNLHVFEKDIAQLQIGQQLVAYNNMNPDKKYRCEIILISHDVNSEGYTEVHCHFEEYAKSLLPGMYMNAELPINSKLTYAIDEEAIVNFEGANYLFVQNENNSCEMVLLNAGNKTNNYVEIINYSQFLNKKIVKKGAYTLLMALKNKEEE